MVITAFVYSPIADKIGRKLTLLTTAIPYFLAIILIAVAENIYLFYLSRILVGMGDACIFTTLPSYVGEISTPKVRGSWGNVPICYGLLGQVFINAVGGYLDVKTTAWMSLVFPIIFVATFSFAPESPYFYIMKSKRSEARKALQWLRGCDNVDAELSAIEAAIKRQLSESCSWKELFTNESSRKGLKAGVFLRTAQMFSGTACFASYMQYIFEMSPGNISPVNATIICNVLSFLTTLCAAYFLDKMGRRLIVATSLAGCALSLTCVASYFYIEHETSVDLSNLTWIPLVGTIFYVMVYSFGLVMVPTLMLGELFSANAKMKALPLLTGVMGFWISVTTKLFHLLYVNFGMYTPFMFFGACCFCNVLLSFYFVPETRGKTLEEIQLSLKK